MVRFVKEVGAVQWSVFFLVPMGRGQELSMITPERHERVFEWLHDLALAGDFDVKATAAPMYRRVAMQRGVGRTVGGAGFAFHDGLNRPAQGVNDGRGFLFVSHLGEITPSGFLPLTAGNVRTDDVVDVYRNHALFRSLRDPDQLTGKCAVPSSSAPSVVANVAGPTPSPATRSPPTPHAPTSPRAGPKVLTRPEAA